MRGSNFLMAGYKVLAIVDEMLASHWQGEHHYKMVSHPLPKDAKFCSMHRNARTKELEFIIFSETYEWTKPGSPLPYVEVPMMEDLK